MPSFDYNASAELFCENYRRFATAAEAIRYAVETDAQSLRRVA
jgi:hypothetical protein